jgi:RNA polymerase sigma-70 factor, ECF subfamily
VDLQDESKLVDAALQGDANAFASLVESCQSRLYNAMIHVTGNTEDAEDVVQEAFIQAYLKLNTFQRSSRFYTWVYRIAFNFALSKHRRRRPVRSLDQTREVSGSEPISQLDNAETRMIQTEHILSVQTAITELSEDHRAIIVLRDMHGMSYEDIAEILNTPLGTVRSRLNRARSQLKVQLEKRSDWQE